MEIKVHLVATFKLIAGASDVVVPVQEDATILDVIQGVVERYPVLRTHWMNDNGELHAHVHVFLNGNDAATLPDRLLTLLQTGDEVDVIPPVAGG